jgi:hypothetical protein
MFLPQHNETKDNLYKELELVFEQFPNYHMKVLLGILVPVYLEKIFSNQQLGMRVYTKLIKIMGLESPDLNYISMIFVCE